MPATLFLVGDKDPLVPVSTAERFIRKISEKGAEGRLVVYQGGKHGFFNARYKYYDKVMKEIVNFVQKHN